MVPTFAALALLLILPAQLAAGQQQRIAVRDVPVLSLPRAMPHQGKPMVAKRWTDRLGENKLVLTQTGKRRAWTCEFGEDACSDAEVYAYHYVRKGAATSLLWRTTDFMRGCSFDLYAGYLSESVAITDLVREGVAESSFMYLLACRSDLSPATLKLIMHEGAQKYAGRGTSRPRGAPAEQRTWTTRSGALPARSQHSRASSGDGSGATIGSSSSNQRVALGTPRTNRHSGDRMTLVLEETSGAQREAGDRLFRLIEELAGEPPQLLPSRQAYKTPSERGVFLYIDFISRRARKHPPLSICMMARWDDQLGGEGVVRRNNWFGSNHSADLSVRPDHPEDMRRAERFIRDAYRLRSRSATK